LWLGSHNIHARAGANTQLRSTMPLSMLCSVLPLKRAGKLPAHAGHHGAHKTLQMCSDQAESPSSLRAHTGILCAGAFCAAPPVRRPPRHHTLQGALQPQAQPPDAEYCLAGYLQEPFILQAGPGSAAQASMHVATHAEHRSGEAELLACATSVALSLMVLFSCC